ncbi:hypothetical protein A2110_01010 [Candidatus Jorgensenbacteria bacterium GWA1_54_12]|uniref:Uncharacterized protein n=1 Tax=Candidatus Jorgensenbacteria bacterium GWA1_54_12 TaxID=1798468 RepID=A0A1F6BIL8_9BACT|nr:MAG: hypothetical protein A2110_01010 [Candidatus Jorgensenbacteria bacterium GWA1_54_12]
MEVTIMNQEELKSEIQKKLTEMGFENILLRELDENTLIVLFNAKEITSFKEELSGWIYSGIYLDHSNERQYRIDFRKVI